MAGCGTGAWGVRVKSGLDVSHPGGHRGQQHVSEFVGTLAAEIPLCEIEPHALEVFQTSLDLRFAQGGD